MSDTALKRWITGQFVGLASALDRIHQQSNVSMSARSKTVYPRLYNHRSRHGDIKPENILWFKERTDEAHPIGGTLKITDFGLARSHPIADQDEFERPRGYSRTYRAPEFDIKGAIGGAYDLWSFGCVVLETAVWLIRGWEGVTSFALSRAGRTGRGDDAFFERSTSRTQCASLVNLKPEVVQVGPICAHV